MTEQTGNKTAGADSESRQYYRLPKAYSVEVKELSFPMSSTNLIESNVNDISKGGICVESANPLAPGLTMQVRVNIPMLNKFSASFLKIYENDAEQYFLAIAKTVWCKPSSGKYMIGMEFINVDETQSNALAALIDKAAREAGGK